MILLLLLLIPIIGSIVISMVPVSELSEQEAKSIVEQKIEAENSSLTLTTEEISNKIGAAIETLLKQENYTRTRLVQILGITTSLITFLISIYMWVLFDSSVNQYQFVYNFDSISFCHLYIGIDGISLYFVLLTTFLTPIAILANLGSITNNIKYFIISFLLLESLQIALFVVLDLLLFYIFFESILPILFLVIIIYGTGEDRVRSSFLFFLYTLAGSLFMLLAILQIYNYVGSTDFQLLSLSEISLESQIILWAAFFLALAVKTPLIPVHMWLPRAHTSAPLGGSILLAGRGCLVPDFNLAICWKLLKIDLRSFNNLNVRIISRKLFAFTSNFKVMLNNNQPAPIDNWAGGTLKLENIKTNNNLETNIKLDSILRGHTLNTTSFPSYLARRSW